MTDSESSFMLIKSFPIINNASINDLKVLTEDDIILVDSNISRLLLFKTKERKWKSVQIPGIARFLTVIPNNIVAVTLPSKNKVITVNAKHERVIKEAIIDDVLCGLTYTNSKIYISCKEKGILVLNLRLEILDVVTEIRGEMILESGFMKQLYCVCIHGDTLFRLDTISKTHMELNLIKNQNSQRTMSSSDKNHTFPVPNNSVSVDAKGFIYLSRNSVVQQISSDFAKQCFIMSFEPDTQIQLSYDTKTKTLIICDNSVIYFYRDQA
ncbi:unnamed protein product [Mytilus coruscus]|uniref:Uncharacterized protein n=1 Tax=Mytilus coruscus TaxID=42192 RepID=A0A6J8DHY3_MYTCO|nr:unnamed protein product [Mytilus coruscus]